MNINQAIINANRIYKQLGKAHVRKGAKDEPLSFRGKLVTGDQSSIPCGLLVCITTEPEAILKIIQWDLASERPPADTVAEEALSELGGMISMHRGLGGILWLNAGTPGILGAGALGNAARSYDRSLAQEDADQPYRKRSRELHWDQFTSIGLTSIPPKTKKGKTTIAVDWLLNLRERGGVEQAVQESPPEPEVPAVNESQDGPAQSE